MHALLESKPPHNTLIISLMVDDNEPLSVANDVISQLGNLGWTQYPHSAVTERFQRIVGIHLYKPGSGMFTSWTPEEATKFTKDAKTVLRKAKVRCVRKKLTLADLM